MRQIAIVAAAASLALWLPVPALGDQMEPPSITVTGTGSVSFAPDIARLSVGVRAEETTAALAARMVASRAQAVINAVRAQGIADADIATSYYTIEYQPPQNEQPAAVSPMSLPRKPLTGGGTYVATESIDVKAPLAKAGAVLDAAVGAGANETYGISFDTSQRTALYHEALARAVADARAQAEIVAKAAGVSIAGVERISVGGGPMPLARGPMMEAMAQPATPVMGGTGTIEAGVEVVYRIR